MTQEKFDSWDDFDTVDGVSAKAIKTHIQTRTPIQIQTQTPKVSDEPSETVETGIPVEEPPKRRGGRKKQQQIETPVEITEEVEPVEEAIAKEVK